MESIKIACQRCEIKDYYRSSPVILNLNVSLRVKRWYNRVKDLPDFQQEGLAGHIVNLENRPEHTELLKLILEGALIQLEKKYEGVNIGWKDAETPYLIIGKE